MFKQFWTLFCYILAFTPKKYISFTTEILLQNGVKLITNSMFVCKSEIRCQRFPVINDNRICIKLTSECNFCLSVLL